MNTVEFDFMNAWELTGVPKDAAAFVRAIPKLVPEGSVLYWESCSLPSDLKAFLKERPAKSPCKLKKGTILPTPDIYHMDICDDNILPLAKVLDGLGTGIGSDHIHVYKDGKVLVSGYDAFFDPFYVSKDISEEKVQEFCKALDCSYKTHEPYASRGVSERVKYTIVCAIPLLILSILSVNSTNSLFEFCLTKAYGFPLPWYVKYCECEKHSPAHDPVYWTANLLLIIVGGYILGAIIRRVFGLANGKEKKGKAQDDSQ